MPQGISRHKSDTKAVIAVGSNVAFADQSSEALVEAAFSAIESESVRLLCTSGLYKTPCVPKGAGPDYVNAVALVETNLSAESLLALLHRVEEAFDRTREERWASRTLDLDLLDHAGRVAPNRELWQKWHDLPFEQQKSLFPEEMILPHPRIQDRAFVLVPLVDILPDWRHPVLGRSARELLAELTEDQLAGIEPI